MVDTNIADELKVLLSENKLALIKEEINKMWENHALFS